VRAAAIERSRIRRPRDEGVMVGYQSYTRDNARRHAVVRCITSDAGEIWIEPKMYHEFTPSATERASAKPTIF
jgi:hypothetical protein